jgi:urease accessory protein
MRVLSVLAFIVFSFPSAALAHPGDVAGGALHGLAHPFAGLDHLLAMLAVGVWAARFSGAARWPLPAAFVGFMAVGAALGGAILLPFVEPMIALSVLVLGLATAIAVRLPVWAGGAVVALFALYHGHGHFAEMPADTSVAGFSAGMLTATALLHLTGMLVALQLARVRTWLPQVLGGAVSLAGAWLLVA